MFFCCIYLPYLTSRSLKLLSVMKSVCVPKKVGEPCVPDTCLQLLPHAQSSTGGLLSICQQEACMKTANRPLGKILH